MRVTIGQRRNVGSSQSRRNCVTETNAKLTWVRTRRYKFQLYFAGNNVLQCLIARIWAGVADEIKGAQWIGRNKHLFRDLRRTVRTRDKHKPNKCIHIKFQLYLVVASDYEYGQIFLSLHARHARKRFTVACTLKRNRYSREHCWFRFCGNVL